jgi:hypothetical protein
VPAEALTPLLPPGLTLDTYGPYGFLAIAMVETQGLRPSFVPAPLGRDFFLTGYRIFARFRSASGQTLRGLRILRSDTDRRAMVLFGNLLTHYGYRKAEVALEASADRLEIDVRTKDAEADVHVVADLSSKPAPLPPGSPFRSLEDARHFAGPLPYTFDYEKETHSIVLIKGVRRAWDPQPVKVEISRATFLDHEPWKSARPVLANAFHLSRVPYSWRPGVREALPAPPA